MSALGQKQTFAPPAYVRFTPESGHWRFASALCQRALESLQKVQVVTIRVFETDHTGAPGLVLRRIIELHTSLSQCRIQRINICHGQADVIDARWIAEQAQLPSHRRRIVLLRREYEQVYGAGCHHHAAVVSVSEKPSF